jgi:hypothetical protein
VEVRIYLDESQKIFFADKELEVEVYHPPVRMSVDEKVEVILEEKEAKKVRKDSHVEYGNKFYSVKAEFIGKLVVVKEYGDNLLFYHHKKLIESHNKIKNPYVKNNTKLEHLKPWQATLLTTSVYRRAAMGMGKNVDKVVFIILQKGQGVVDNKTIWSIIGLKKAYTKKAIDESCEFAIATSSVCFRTIQAHLNLRYRKTVNE